MCNIRALLGIALLPCLLGQGSPPDRQPAPAPSAGRPAPTPQARPHGHAVEVIPELIRVDDGDTVTIRWREGDEEVVRILGIDSPETRHDEHRIPLDQPFGPEARAFAQGAFATATQVELIRAATLDPYGRTLGYLTLNGKNYSVLVIRARLAEESVGRYGDNGFPREAAEVTAAARAAGPLPFEPPGLFRSRMRKLSDSPRPSDGSSVGAGPDRPIPPGR
jgi:micrococcal nuclease